MLDVTGRLFAATIAELVGPAAERIRPYLTPTLVLSHLIATYLTYQVGL